MIVSIVVKGDRIIGLGNGPRNRCLLFVWEKGDWYLLEDS